jgi:hypothetical protein
MKTMDYRLRSIFLISLLLTFLVVSTLVFHRITGNVAYCIDLIDYWDDAGSSWRVDLFTGNVIQLSTAETNDTPEGQPSPDGKYSASTILTDHWKSLYRLEIRDLSTGLISYTADNVRSSVEWSPDSQWLLYVQSLESHNNIVITRTDGSDQRTYPYSRDSQFDHFAWSPDGKTLALNRVVINGANEQYLDLLSVPDLKVDQSLELSTNVYQVKWSPSSDRVYLEGEAVQLLVYVVEDGAWQQIIIEPDPVWSPTNLHLFWSPSEEYLITQYSYSDLGFAVRIFDREGSEVVDLFLTPGEDPRVKADYYWLDDHTFLLSAVSVTATDMTDNLTLFDLLAGTQTTLLEGVSGWQISPDKEWVAAMPWYDSPNLNLRLLPLADLHSRPAEIQLAGNIYTFDWTTDGNALVTYPGADQDSGASMDMYDVKTGLRVPVELVGVEIPDTSFRLRRASCGEF